MAWRGAAEEDPTACGVTFTFDTGMLIALERRKRRATDAFRAIVRRGSPPRRSGRRLRRVVARPNRHPRGHPGSSDPRGHASSSLPRGGRGPRFGQGVVACGCDRDGIGCVARRRRRLHRRCARPATTAASLSYRPRAPGSDRRSERQRQLQMLRVHHVPMLEEDRIERRFGLLVQRLESRPRAGVHGALLGGRGRNIAAKVAL